MKKTTRTFALLFVLIISCSESQTQNKTVQKIRNTCRKIDSNLDTYQKKSVLWEEAEEGAEGTAYYKKGHLKMFHVSWRGETGKKEINYYFNAKRQLIFQQDNDYRYNRPIYYTKKIAAENNDTEAYDPKKTTVQKQKYYFENEELIHWIDGHNNVVDLKYEKNTGKRLVSEMKELIQKIKK